MRSTEQTGARMPPEVWTASITLPPERTSPRAARALFRLALDQWHIADVDSADLLLSELVTNAVVHARTPLSLRVAAREGWARVEVQDGSPEAPASFHATPRSEHGRGLLLLDRLADDWGWTADTCPSRGKSVWFEVTSDHGAQRPGSTLEASFDLDTVDPI